MSSTSTLSVNDSPKKDLVNAGGITDKQATIIIDNRPFQFLKDVEKKTQSPRVVKKLQNALFELRVSKNTNDCHVIDEVDDDNSDEGSGENDKDAVDDDNDDVEVDVNANVKKRLFGFLSKQTSEFLFKLSDKNRKTRAVGVKKDENKDAKVNKLMTLELEVLLNAISVKDLRECFPKLESSRLKKLKHEVVLCLAGAAGEHADKEDASADNDDNDNDGEDADKEDASADNDDNDNDDNDDGIFLRRAAEDA
jgi:hypothetical protein